MSFGPSAPKVNYKDLWKSYSGSLHETKSLYGSGASTSRAKAAKSGILGATPNAIQDEAAKGFRDTLKGLRQSEVGSSLKNMARGSALRQDEGYFRRGSTYSRNIVDEKGNTTFSHVSREEALGLNTPEYQSQAVKFKEQFGITPKYWELILFNKFGANKPKVKASETSMFKAQESAGRSAKGVLALGPSAVNAQTKSPWV